MPLTSTDLATSPSSLADGLVAHLRAAVIRRELRPGETVTEAGLAAALGVSRTPVREALRRLADLGLVQMTVGRGYVVTPIDVTQLREMTVLVSELLGLAARLSADYLEDQEQVWTAQTTPMAVFFTPATDPAAWLPSGGALGDLLLQRCGNALLVDAIDRCRPHLRRLQAQHQLPVPDASYTAIVDAIHSRDRERLSISVRDHYLHIGIALIDAELALQDAVPLRQAGGEE